jgi:hypothetical protein
MRKTIAALVGAAATATMITGAGVAAASAGQPAAATRPAAISLAAAHPASMHAAVTRTEHFQELSASLSNSAKSPLAAYGAFNASGTDTQGTGKNTDTFTFPGGSFRIVHKVTHDRQHFRVRTCSGTEHQRGVYTISDGTGKYAGISGSGHFKFRLLIVADHTSHGCSHRPVAVQVVIRAHGPVTLP